jgi:hypothetical protein
MILEGIVTTLDAAGAVHVAPMGPHVDPEWRQILLRPYPTSQTCRNLQAHAEGVLHVTDDVLLLARAALGRLDSPPACFPASRVRGFVLADACRFFEFRTRSWDEREERVRIEAEIVHAGRLRDFFGFNRAKHAIVEAAILATRTDFLPLDDIEAEYRRLAVLVEKTGGPQEHEAFALLRDHLARVRSSRVASPGVSV